MMPRERRDRDEINAKSRVSFLKIKIRNFQIVNEFFLPSTKV